MSHNNNTITQTTNQNNSQSIPPSLPLSYSLKHIQLTQQQAAVILMNSVLQSCEGTWTPEAIQCASHTEPSRP